MVAFYEQLYQIYAKDRASRKDAQTVVDILDEIAEEVNQQTIEELHDFEDENNFQPALEEMDISSIQRSTSVSTSSKKRKANEIGEPITEKMFIKAATLLSDKIEIVGKELNKSIESKNGHPTKG